MKKYTPEVQKLLAIWAADCAEKVLPFFEKAYPRDKRPRQAIKAGRDWVRTAAFKMADIRGASLAAHAAAREAKENKAACFAARAAGLRPWQLLMLLSMPMVALIMPLKLWRSLIRLMF